MAAVNASAPALPIKVRRFIFPDLGFSEGYYGYKDEAPEQLPSKSSQLQIGLTLAGLLRQFQNLTGTMRTQVQLVVLVNAERGNVVDLFSNEAII